MNWIWVVYAFTTLLVLRLLYFARRFWAVRRIAAAYDMFMAGQGVSLDGLRSRCSELRQLLRDAGIEEPMFPIAEPVGFNHIATGKASIIGNLGVSTERAMHATLSMFSELQGYYRARTLETLNPLFWAEFVVFLAKHILSYVGCSAESVITRVANLLYWLSVPMMVAYRDSLYSMLEGLAERLP